MGYIVRPNEGLHFSIPSFPNCVVAAYDTGGLGQVVILGTAPVGSIDYFGIKVLWGPGDMANVSLTEGPFLNNVIVPVANAAIHELVTYNAQALPGTAVVNIPNTNDGLKQYFYFDPATGKLVFKPYP